MSAGMATKIITDIGVGAIYSAVTTLTSTAKNVYMLTTEMSDKHKLVEANIIHNTLVKIDLKLNIEIVELILKEIPKDKIHSKAILAIISSLSDSIILIESELKKINDMLNYNKTLWMFVGWRSYDCTEPVNKLIEYNDMLVRRRAMLFDLLNIKCELVMDNTITLDAVINK